VTSPLAKEVQSLKEGVEKHLSLHGAGLAQSVADRAHLLLVWLQYARSKSKCKEAERLLDAVQGAIIEVSGALAMGLVRSAIFSLRTQLELFFAWIYFNDHGIEWARVCGDVSQFPMRAFFWKYFSDYGNKFPARLKLLEKSKTRKSDDLYGVLSIHVHSTSMLVAPSVGPLSDLVYSEPLCSECVKLQTEVAEYLSDVMMAWFSNDWHDLPNEI